MSLSRYGLPLGITCFPARVIHESTNGHEPSRPEGVVRCMSLAHTEAGMKAKITAVAIVLVVQQRNA
eukprot:6180817-Pleurochrysis_carterae.AAC.1